MSVVLGVEALCAAQGIEARAPLTTAASLQMAIKCLRSAIPPLTSDRYMATDLVAAANLIKSDALAQSAGIGIRI